VDADDIEIEVYFSDEEAVDMEREDEW